MIDKAILFLQQEIKEFLQLKLNLEEDRREKIISISNLLKQDGKVDVEENSLALTLINLEEEHTLRGGAQYINFGDDHGKINPGLHLQMYLMVAAHFNNYEEALKLLALVIQFFQGKNAFHTDTSAYLKKNGIQKLNVKLFSSKFETLNHIWGTLGAKYMPSVIYKVTLISLQQEKILEVVPSTITTDKDMKVN